MKRFAVGVLLASCLGLFTGAGSASNSAHWVMTDVAAQARLEFPHYTGVALVGMTSDGRVIWTAQQVGASQYDREVFQWQDGKITDLGPLPRHSLPEGFNAAGAMVGGSQDPPYCPFSPPPGYKCTPGPTHAYLWQSGQVTQLGWSGTAWAVNDRGQVVGSGDPWRGKTHAFLWQGGKLTDLGTGGGFGNAASAINDRGQVLETYSTKKGWKTVLWQNRKTTPIAAPARDYQIRALNDRGQVIGEYTRAGGQSEAFLWDRGKVTDLGPTFPGYPMEIDDRGDVLHVKQTSDASGRGILWHNGKSIDLGSLGGAFTVPIAIDARGQVVGMSTFRRMSDGLYDLHAFIWQNGKLQMLPSDGSVLQLDAVMAINPAGTLIAGGTTPFECDQNGCDGQLLVWQYR